MNAIVRKPIEAQTTDQRMLKLVRDVEKQIATEADGDGHLKQPGTGQTILKQRKTPIQKLIDDGKIGPEEIEAAGEIDRGFNAIARSLSIRGMVLERIDSSGGDRHIPIKALRSVRNYQRWATYWSERKKQYSDPMLEIIIAAVIDERPVRTIGAELSFHHATIERALIAGLRDYAARMDPSPVDAKIGDQWIADAERKFVPMNNPELLKAIRRAKIEI